MYACNLLYIIYSTIFPLYLGYSSPLPITAMNSVELTLQHSIFRSFDLKFLWNPPELKPALHFTFSTSIFVQGYFISYWLLQFKIAFKENHCCVALPILSFPTRKARIPADEGFPRRPRLVSLIWWESWGTKPTRAVHRFWEFQGCSGGRWCLVSHGNRIKSKIRDVSKTEFLSSHCSYHWTNIPPTDLKQLPEKAQPDFCPSETLINSKAVYGEQHQQQCS